MQYNLDIKTIFGVLRERLKWIVLSVVLGLVIFLLVSQFLIPRKYVSSISMYVNNQSQQVNNLNLNDYNAAQKLVDTYIVVLQNSEVLEQVSEKLSTPLSASALREMISMKSVNGTVVLQISAETTDPKLSAEICDTMAKVAPDVLKDIIEVGSVKSIGKANVPTAPSSPDVKKNAALGALLGLFLSSGIILLVYILDNRVKSEEEFKFITSLAVLAEIPSMDEIIKGGNHG